MKTTNIKEILTQKQYEELEISLVNEHTCMDNGKDSKASNRS